MTVDAPSTLEEALAMAEEAAQLQWRADELTAAVAPMLSAYRSTANLSQAFLASSAGVTQAAVSRIESGERRSVPTVYAMTRALYDYTSRAGSDLAAARKET